MEQLSLLEFNETRRPTQGKEVAFESVCKGFQLQYEHPNGKPFQGNSIDWLASLDGSSIMSASKCTMAWRRAVRFLHVHIRFDRP